MGEGRGEGFFLLGNTPESPLSPLARDTMGDHNDLII
jgi:hypothetical protein